MRVCFKFQSVGRGASAEAVGAKTRGRVNPNGWPGAGICLPDSCNRFEYGGVEFCVWSRKAAMPAMSKRGAIPPRTAVFPFPNTSQAKPNRGLKFRREGLMSTYGVTV